MNWLEVFQNDLKEIQGKDLINPGAPFDDDHDNHVGYADDYLRRLYTIMMTYQKRSELALLEAKYAKRDRASAIRMVWEFNNKAEAASKIFWIEVNEKFNLWGKSNVGIRDEWRVVWSESEGGGFLRRLFGE